MLEGERCLSIAVAARVGQKAVAMAQTAFSYCAFIVTSYFDKTKHVFDVNVGITFSDQFNIAAMGQIPALPTHILFNPQILCTWHFYDHNLFVFVFPTGKRSSDALI